MTKKSHIQRVHIWDDPESRINFLETTLADKEWEAVIYEPTADKNSGRLPLLREELAAKGYKTSMGHDANGIPTLTLTHFSHETNLLKVFGELGFTKGMRQTFDTAGQRLGDSLTSLKNMVNYFFVSEGRRFSTLYAFGDLALGGLITNTGKRIGVLPKDPAPTNESLKTLKNDTKLADNLYDLGYDLAFLQSVIMMFGMKEGKELIRDEALMGVKKAKELGLDLSDFDAWAHEIKDRRSSAHKWFNDNAIRLGPAAQILGQLLLIGSGLSRLSKTRNFVKNNDIHLDIRNEDGQEIDMEQKLRATQIGAVGDVLTGSLSVAGWTLMGFFKENKIEDKIEWRENFFKRLAQEIQESPNRLASVCVTLASVIGLKAGGLKFAVQETLEDQQQWETWRDLTSHQSTLTPDQRAHYATLEYQKYKEDQKGFSLNKQQLGNAIYLIGDGTVAFTRNRDYEAAQVANIEAMAVTAIDMFNMMPLAYGPKGKLDMVDKLSHSLAVRIESLHDPKNPLPEDYQSLDAQQRIQLYRQRIRDEVISLLPEANQRFDAIVERAADVVLRFSQPQQKEVGHTLAKALAASQNIAAEDNEIFSAIETAILRKQSLIKQPGIQLKKAIMAVDIEKPLADLVRTIPGEHTADDAMRLHTELRTHLLRSKESDTAQFVHHIDNSDHAKATSVVTEPHPRINNTQEKLNAVLGL